MNRVNYLFDACVSHRNTQKVQREAEDFFAREEGKFYHDMENRRHQVKDMTLYPIDVIVPLLTEENEKTFCKMYDIKWFDYSKFEPCTEGRDNFYYILMCAIMGIAYAQDVYEDRDPQLAAKRNWLSDVFHSRYDAIVPDDIMCEDFCSHNDI